MSKTFAFGVPKGRVARILGILALGGLTVGALIAFSIVRHFGSIDRLTTHRPDTTAFMQRYLRARAESGSPSRLQWQWVGYADIAPTLKRAVLVSEDINFFSHDGFDEHEIGEALRDAWEQKEFPRGASTLTQQLARNLYLSPSITPWRKLAEAILTRKLESTLSKRRILEIYLNVVEFGPGIYGAEAASRHYFGIAAADLDEHQAAELAAVLPRPSTWHPGRQTRGYQQAVERILRRMEKAQFLLRLI